MLSILITLVDFHPWTHAGIPLNGFGSEVVLMTNFVITFDKYLTIL